MPQLGVMAWLAIASLAGTAAETGYQVANAPGGPDTKAIDAQQQAQANQQALQKKEAIVASQGQGQAQVGGSLTDTGFNEFISQLAGYPGYYGSSAAGQNGPGTQTTASQQTQNQQGGSPDVMSALKTLGVNQQPGQGQISGGNWPSTPTVPQQWFELSNPVA